MKVLITGGSGLLGKSLIETAPKNIELFATYKKNGFIDYKNTNCIWYHLDITNRIDIYELMETVRPNLIIHCAAIGNVDYTEGHYQDTFRVNVTGAAHVAELANGFKAKFVYISSNAVFDGNNPKYNEKSALNPVNAYGVIKKHAERTIQDLSNNWLIIRPFLLYGWPFLGGRTNWAKRIIEALINSDSLKLVNDHIWQPTYAPDCAEAIWQLIPHNNEIFNVASSERATLYEFGLKVCEVFELEKNLIQPISSGFFFNAAKRPHDTSYDLVKLEANGIALSDIRTGLEKMKKAEK